MLETLARAALSGTAVSLASTIALALAAKAEGRHPVRPTNATGHWVRGDEAAASRAFDAKHTLLGFATHEGASIFWAAIFQALRKLGPNRPASVDAIGVSALAAFVDYLVVPKRLTPGWEKVVTPPSIGLAYGVMALALWATSSPSGKLER
ncbi:hypothetical protein AB6806_19770 [Bosea sp. RCC_152_1]|uniref:hypothetical protein n=1 Tax=Bosea sp. RCC_152_1 TaxID=3239228 RepID=UPI0035264A87